MEKKFCLSATNGTSSPSRHFGSSFGHKDYEPVGPSNSNPVNSSNGARYSNTTGANGAGEMYDVPVGRNFKRTLLTLQNPKKSCVFQVLRRIIYHPV